MTRLAIVLTGVALLARGACLPVRSGRIAAGDLVAGAPALAGLPADLDLGFSPTPGAVRVFTAAELNQRLALHGLQASVAEPVCVEWPMRPLTEQDVRAAMLAVLPEGSDVQLASAGMAAPEGELVFPREGLHQGWWRGYVEYQPRRRFAVSMRADVRAPFSRVVATESIRAGERIAATKLKLETGIGEPRKGDFAEAIEEVAGRAARRSIRAGMPVERSATAAARAIAKGDRVRVDVISGGASLRFDGVAETAAGTGEVAAVRNPDTGKIVHAQVDEHGRALLRLSGN